jgi:phage replication initiation protein
MLKKPVISMGYKIDWFQCTEASKNDEVLDVLDSDFWNFLKKIGYNLNDFETASPRYFYNSGLTLDRYFNIY